MRAAIYDRFWHSMGGGERHCGMIAQLLSQSGVEVDLIGHQQISVDQLANRLALDLGKVSLVVTPDRGEEAMSEFSADYDLFVNSSYMSRVVSRARRAAYLFFFLTPFYYDHGTVHLPSVRYDGSTDRR